MKILHTVASPFWSGPLETIVALALAQRALGHQVSVAIDRKRKTAPSEELAAPRLDALGLLDEGGLELSVKSTPLGIWRDIRRLRSLAVDLLHCHFTHDHWICRYGKPAGAKLVRSVHAPRSLERSLLAADAVTVAVDVWRPQVVHPRVMTLPALVAARYVAADRHAAQEALGLDGAPLIGMVSTFQPSRRHDLAIDAFALLHAQRPQARLVLVGDGALLGETRARVERAGLTEVVRFVGYQPDVVPYLQAFDQVWVLGLGNDWSGRAAAQARACGAEVIAVDDGELGRYASVALVDPTASELAQAAAGSVQTPARVRLADHEATARELLALVAK